MRQMVICWLRLMCWPMTVLLGIASVCFSVFVVMYIDQTTDLVLFLREKYAMMFDEPVLLQLGWWYVAWARVSGPSSDCGSHGQATITTDDG